MAENPLKSPRKRVLRRVSYDVPDTANKTPSKAPKWIFRKVEDLDRTRKMMLGLALPYAKKVPWGYKVGFSSLEPIDICFKALVLAKEFLLESSYEDVAAWITRNTGHYISANTLNTIMRTRRPDDRAALPRKQRRRL